MKKLTIYIKDNAWEGSEWVSDRPFTNEPLDGERRFRVEVELPDHPRHGERLPDAKAVEEEKS